MESTQHIWDPFHETISQLNVAGNEKTQKTIQYYQDHPKRTLIIKYCLIGLIVLSLCLLLNRSFFTIGIYAVIIACTLFGVYIQMLKRLESEAILLLLCQKNHWVFEAGDDQDSLSKLAGFFPDIFNLGYDRHLTDQLWGSLVFQNTPHQFWMSHFQYTEGSGKSRHVFNYYIFGMPLPQPLTVSFSLQHGFIPIGSRIKTESEEFNNAFLIHSSTTDEQTKQAIFDVLTPSSQVRLLEFVKKYNQEMHILFQADVLFIVLQEPLWVANYTDFTKHVGVDQRDEDVFMKIVADFMTLPAEMLQYT